MLATVQLLYNIIHKSAYLADQARQHQLHIHMNQWAPQRVYPINCVLHNDMSNIQHEIFDCHYIQHIWNHSNLLIDQMQGQIKAKNINELLIHITNIQHTDKPNGFSFVEMFRTHVNLNIILLTIKSIWDTYLYKMKLYQENDTDIINKTLKKLNQIYAVQLNYEISLMFAHRHTIKKQAKTRFNTPDPRIDERQKVVWPQARFQKLMYSTKVEDVAKATWLKTYMVTTSPVDLTMNQLAISAPILFTPWPP